MSEPIRLLQIASSSHIGGAEQLMLNAIRYADPARFVPFLLSLTGQGPLARLAEQAGTRGHNWALKEVADPRLLRRMQLYLRRHPFHIVQCYGLRAELLTRWVAHGARLPLVSSIVSIDTHRGPVARFLDRATWDGVTLWMSTSRAAARAKIEREGVPAGRVFVVPTGIPDRPVADPAARAKARAKLGVAEDAGPVLAIVANVREAKGYPDLIDAVARLREKRPGIVCLCAGRDDSEGRIPALAEERGVGGNMRWLGFRPDAPLAYDAADLAVLASHREGMPHSLIEAIRAGRATVATDVGGVSEVVRHEREGLLVPARDPAALAAAIDRALTDSAARAAWAASARARYEESFGVELMVERMTEVYEYALGRGPRPEGLGVSA